MIWVIEISTESGDDYGAHLFTREPTGDELERYLKTLEPDETFHGDEENGCPGFRGSNFHISSYEGGGLLDPGDF